MADCTGFIEPLNLECMFLNVLAGSAEVFTFLAMVFIAAMAARFRMRVSVALAMFVLFAVMFSQFLPGVYLIIVLLSGIIIFFAVGRIVK